jgi:hypothetical protein
MLPVEVVLSAGQGSSCVAPGDGVLVVESRSGRRIEVGRGFDSETLERLLTILDKVLGGVRLRSGDTDLRSVRRDRHAEEL